MKHSNTSFIHYLLAPVLPASGSSNGLTTLTSAANSSIHQHFAAMGQQQQQHGRTPIVQYTQVSQTHVVQGCDCADVNLTLGEHFKDGGHFFLPTSLGGQNGHTPPQQHHHPGQHAAVAATAVAGAGGSGSNSGHPHPSAAMLQQGLGLHAAAAASGGGGGGGGGHEDNSRKREMRLMKNRLDLHGSLLTSNPLRWHSCSYRTTPWTLCLSGRPPGSAEGRRRSTSSAWRIE